MAKPTKSKSPYPLTFVILAKNAQETLAGTLASVPVTAPIIVVDDDSTDRTVDIALSHKAHILSIRGDFAKKRTEVLSRVTTPWVFYLDADESISEQLKEKITNLTEPHQVPAAYSVARENFFLGTRMYPDRVDRLFHKDILKGWHGQVHESPILTTPSVSLAEHLVHHTHQDITSMLEKTNKWSEIEARLRFEAHHPPVQWWRLIRIALTILWQQLLEKRVWRFGRAGVFEGYFQIIDKLIVYVKLYEKQMASLKR